jgi:very-short-patch-repair endonuclease
VVARRQLLASQISSHVIDHWVRTGFLYPLHRGVYAVGHRALAPFAQEMAALMACGEDAVISHTSAAYMWGLIEMPRRLVDVTVASGPTRGRGGINLHRNRLSKREIRTRHGLSVTSPARTIIDLALTARPDELERLIAEARVKRLIREGELEKALAASGTRPGTGRLRTLLRAEGQPGLTRSEAERMLRRLLRQAGLPQPRTNVRLGHYEADFLWEAEKVVLEVDSWQFHGHRCAFENDRRKSLALQAAGYQVIRVTADQLRDEPIWVIAQVARALTRAEQSERTAA